MRIGSITVIHGCLSVLCMGAACPAYAQARAGNINGAVEDPNSLSASSRLRHTPPPAGTVGHGKSEHSSASTSGGISVGPAERKALYERYLELSHLITGWDITPHWLEDGDSFWFAVETTGGNVINRVDPESNTITPLFDPERLRSALSKALGHEPSARGAPFKTFEFVDDEERVVAFAVEGRRFVLDPETYALSPEPPEIQAKRQSREPRVYRERYPVTGGPVRELPSSDGRWLAREEDHNIWLRSASGGQSRQLTSDGVARYQWRLAPYVGHPAWSGFALWSPDGSSLAALRQDTRQVHHMPAVRWLKPHVEVDWLAYPTVGGKLPQTELAIIDVSTKRQIPVDTGPDPDQSLYPVHWTPDGSELLFLRHDRLMKRLDLMASDAVTGESRVIVSDRQDTFIEGLRFSAVHGSYFTPLEGGGRFLWLSQRSGWKHIYLYSLDGSLLRQLTSGEYPVSHVIAVDETNGWVYFAAATDSDRPLSTQLYRVDFEGRQLTRLTEGNGHHGRSSWTFSELGERDIRFSPSMRYFIDYHSSFDRPPVAELRRADGTLVRVLARADIDALDPLNWCPPEVFKVKADDGATDLHGILYKPWDFDPTREYPVINVLYAGPQMTLVPQTFLPGGPGDFAQALAQLGFITFIVDARGTPGRGKAFQDVAYQSIGRHEIPDHVAALKQLASNRPYVDLSRVGVVGVSYGGYFAARALLLFPDVYHVGVSMVPVAGLSGVRPGPVEPYMGLPQDNQSLFDYASNTRLVDKLEGKLLMAAHALDVNAPFSETMRMVEALTLAGKPYDLLVLPNANHSPGPYTHTPGPYSPYLDEAAASYFVEHLRPDGQVGETGADQSQGQRWCQ